MEKYGFVYIWYDRYRKMYYLGCHWGSIDDGYICSSNRMRDAYRRRPEDFKRRILTKVYTDRKELYEEEQRWFNYIKPEEIGKRYYNLCLSSKKHWTIDPEKRLSVGQKISKANKGKKAWNKGFQTPKKTKEKISKANKGIPRPWFKGILLSEEHKIKLSIAHIGLKYPNRQKMTEEQKEKISKANKGIIFSEEHKMKLSNAAKNRWKRKTISNVQ